MLCLVWKVPVTEEQISEDGVVHLTSIFPAGTQHQAAEPSAGM